MNVIYLIIEHLLLIRIEKCLEFSTVNVYTVTQ